ncbi:MAG TPA: hypothetical protein VLX44_08525 [Xanthobacteraceae bacterium]|nr:hypothetical protein [Xanthobacteraceae bacterium]
MRSLLMAGALSALVLAPAACATPGAGHQSTGAQASFRQSIKAKHPSPMRHQIIRSELNKNEPDVAR